VGHDPGRAAVAVLAILAVLFVASAFPSAGLGGFPGGIGEAPGGSGPGVGPADGIEGGGDPVETEGPEPEPTAEPTTEATTERTERPTETETETETETSTAPAPSPSDGSGGLGALIGALAGVTVVSIGLGGALIAAGVALGVVVPRRRGPSDRLVLEVFGTEVNVGGALSGLSRGSMRFVFGLSSSVGNLVTGLGTATSATLSALGSLGTGSTKALLSLPSGLGKGLAAVGRGLGGAVLSVPAGFGSMLSGIGGTRSEAPSRDPREDPTGSDDDASGTGGDDGPDPPESVEEAWDRFTDRVGVRDRRSRTPGELARVAASRGVPSEPVGRLTRTFREVRYGERPQTDARVRSAREAWARIHDYFTGEEDA
jgi:hypothetical protein